MEFWTGAVLLERALTAASAGFNAAHVLGRLRRLPRRASLGARRWRAQRGALWAMALINGGLLAGALYPLAAARFDAVGRRPVVEAAALGLSLAAALTMTALLVRSRR